MGLLGCLGKADAYVTSWRKRQVPAGRRARAHTVLSETKRCCQFSMHSIESLSNQWLADLSSGFDASLSTKSVGNSSIRPKRAQEWGVGVTSLMRQVLSVPMPSLSTLLSTKYVHIADVKTRPCGWAANGALLLKNDARKFYPFRSWT